MRGFSSTSGVGEIDTHVHHQQSCRGGETRAAVTEQHNGGSQKAHRHSRGTAEAQTDGSVGLSRDESVYARGAGQVPLVGDSTGGRANEGTLALHSTPSSTARARTCKQQPLIPAPRQSERERADTARKGSTVTGGPLPPGTALAGERYVPGAAADRPRTSAGEREPGGEPLYSHALAPPTCDSLTTACCCCCCCVVRACVRVRETPLCCHVSSYSTEPTTLRHPLTRLTQPQRPQHDDASASCLSAGPCSLLPLPRTSTFQKVALLSFHGARGRLW
jgi:hypothetical protein